MSRHFNDVMKPNIFEFEDYRHFLKEMYSYFKGKKKSFSYRSFAKDAGLKSYNYLKLVMDGERNLSAKMLPHFTKGLKLNRQESEFFENLVYFNQAVSLEEKQAYYERLKRFQKYRAIKEIEADQYEYFSKWYYVAIRELVAMEQFQEDPEWISQQLFPKVNPAQAKEALKLLQRLEFLKRDAKGKLILSQPTISSAAEVRSLALMRFHGQMIEKAKESLENVAMENRDISSVTIAVPANQLKKLKDKINEFRNELLATHDSVEGSSLRVYQLNVQLFPLSEIVGGRDG